MKLINRIGLGVGLTTMALLFGFVPRADASVTLLDQNNWKIQMGGFVETDMVRDSTRSFSEVIGTNPVARSGSFKGDNGRLFFSDRNSRLDFTILPPTQGDWKTKGYLEMDFMGYEPGIGSSRSEAAFTTQPAIRIRHAFVQAQRGSWTFLAGQRWSLFGWQPDYVVSTVSVSPGPGVLYERNLQVAALKDISLGEKNRLQAAVSVARPSQQDSQMPNLNVGVRYAFSGRKSAFAAANGDVAMSALSVGVSGTFRQIEVPQSTTDFNGQNNYNGSAVAVDALVPILAGHDDKDIGGNLTWTGEFATGSGYSDVLSGWSGNLPSYPTGSGISNDLNLDKGLGGFDGNGRFELVRLQTWTTQLQYHFAEKTHLFATVGYSQAYSENVKKLTADSGKTIYDSADMYFINLVKDFTAQFRVAAEYGHYTTKYVDGQTPSNDRYQLTAYFRF